MPSVKKMQRKQAYTTIFFFMLAFITLLSGCNKNTVQEEYEPEKAAEINLNLGVAYMQRGQYDVAMHRLGKALEHDSEYADAHNAIAALYERLGQLEKAKYHYEKAVALKPEDSNILNNYGQFLCKQNEWQLADQHFMKAVENPLYKTPEIPYINAGICAYKHDDFNKAESYYRKALKFKENHPIALFQMALLNYTVKHFSVAFDYLNRYLGVSKHTPQTLWLGIRIARALNDDNTESSYTTLLRSQFPDAEEVQLLNASE
jgi:type IV pilus assembly protein PilF